MWRVWGQDRAVDQLRASLERGDLAHAYLFTGPKGVGKTTLALSLAQALNCEGAAPPCGDCRPCRRIAQGTHSDVRLIGLLEAGNPFDGRSHREIVLDQIRQLQAEAHLKPFEGRHRVFILEEAERLNLESANRLLKTLEEPPEGTYIVLISEHPESLLPTVVSRCRRIDLRPATVSQVEAALEEERGLDQEQASLLARLSQGRLGWALAALDAGGPLALRQAAQEELVELLASSLPRRFDAAGTLANRYARDSEGVAERLAQWRLFWRDVLLAKVGCFDVVVNIDLHPLLKAWADKLDVGLIRDAIHGLIETESALRRNANPQLALEVLMLRLPGGAENAEAALPARGG